MDAHTFLHKPYRKQNSSLSHVHNKIKLKKKKKFIYKIYFTNTSFFGNTNSPSTRWKYFYMGLDYKHSNNGWINAKLFMQKVLTCPCFDLKIELL